MGTLLLLLLILPERHSIGAMMSLCKNGACVVIDDCTAWKKEGTNSYHSLNTEFVARPLIVSVCLCMCAVERTKRTRHLWWLLSVSEFLFYAKIIIIIITGLRQRSNKEFNINNVIR